MEKGEDGFRTKVELDDGVYNINSGSIQILVLNQING